MHIHIGCCEYQTNMSDGCVTCSATDATHATHRGRDASYTGCASCARRDGSAALYIYIYRERDIYIIIYIYI